MKTPNEQPKHKRIWLRFTLRMLLVLITVLCIWLGLEVNQVKLEKELAQKITESGGRLRYDYEFDAKGNYVPDATPPKWSATLGEGFLTRIAEVSFTGTTTFTNRIPPTITGVKRKSVPDDVLERLDGLRGLKRLILSNTDVTDDDVDNLRKINSVDYLRLDGNAISANAATQLESLPRLAKLDLRWTKVSQDEIDAVRKALPGVEVAVDYQLEVPPAFWDTMEGDIPIESDGTG